MKKLAIVIGVALLSALVFLVFCAEPRIGTAGCTGGCCQGNDLSEYLDFPYTIHVSPSNVLYVHGYELTGEVVCTWAPGDTMRMNGLAVMPQPKSPPKVIPEETLAKVYGDVPFIRGLVTMDTTWARAAKKFNQKKSDLRLEAGNRYWDVLERTGSDEQAGKAVLDSLESDLLDPDFEPEIQKRILLWKFTGRPREFFMMTGRPDFGAAKRGRGVPSERSARAKLTMWARALRAEGPVVVVIGMGGEAEIGGKDALKALEQIEKSARSGGVVGGPLSKHEVEQILSRKGGRRP